MGLSVDGTRFVAQARQAGVRFDHTLSLGRQHLVVGPERIETILRETGAWPPPQGEVAFREALRASSWRFETFARALGAKVVDSCDASDYEGATIVHDLNQPIDASQEGQFDVILDGGTLEHVFNFPVAIANCMRMLKTDGHLILATPTNNACGHGFYQFSPELFYRVLSKENGFEVRNMIALVDNLGVSSLFGVPYPFPITGRWFVVADPAKIRKRVTLFSRDSVALMVLAQKTAETKIFARTPQQSDYLVQWEKAQPVAASDAGTPLSKWLRSKFNETFCREVLPRLALVLDPFRLARFRKASSFANREFFKPVDKR